MKICKIPGGLPGGWNELPCVDESVVPGVVGGRHSCYEYIHKLGVVVVDGL